MSIDTTLKTTTSSSISVEQPSKPEKTCCSLYKIAKWLITAAFWVAPQQPVTRPLERPSASTLPSTPKPTSSEDSNVLRTKRLIERAQKSKIIAALCKEAFAVSTPLHKSGAWNIIFTDAPDFHAACYSQDRHIRIHSRYSDDEALTLLIFELVNAVHYPRYAKFDQLARENGISREGYAFNCERIEYDTLCLHRQILTAAITEMGWGKNLFAFHHINPDKDVSFKEYWQRCQVTKHTDFFRRQWEALRGESSSI